VKRLWCALLALAFILASLLPLSAQTQGQWVSTGTMQSSREFNAQAKLTNGKVLAAGGIDNSNNVLSSAELYTSNGKWTLTGSMANARAYSSAVVLTNGKVLVAGGLGTGSTLLAAAELYDPTSGTWSSAGSLSVARYAHTATLLSNGKVLVTGGCTASSCSTYTAGSELYDPTSNTWSTTGSLNTARFSQGAVRLKTGKVLVVGGTFGTTSCELYNPATGTWSVAASTNVARYQHTTTFLADGKVLVAGGGSGRSLTNSAEVYDPTANIWTVTGSMVSPRYAGAAALLPDTTVVVAGGYGQSISCGKDCTGYIPFAKAEIYNEATGTFRASSSLPQALANQTITMLGTGRALEAGGIGTTATCCIVENTSSVYTPLSLTFSATSLNFGLLQIGLTSPSQTVTVTNVSSHGVNFTSIAGSGDYAQTNSCTTLAAGASCTVTITFTPTAQGTRTGAVTLKDNSPGSPTQTIALTGTGETLALGFTPAKLNFGSIVVGASSALTATLTNDGSASVNLTGISLAPSNGTYTQTNNCPSSLGVQQTCTFTIVFTPPDVFTYNATLSITNNAGAAATLTMSGTGLNN